MTRLLLFTNDYPYATGDAVFVDKEIHELASVFDDIAVFCYARDTSVGLVDMPSNVFLADNLYGRTEDDRLIALLRPRALADLAAAAWRECRAGRLLRHLRLFLQGAVVGITGAQRRTVREAIAADHDSVAYAFWGMGSGLVLPWLTNIGARVVRLHRFDLYEESAEGGYLPFRRFLFHRADRILAISDDGADYLRRNYAGVIPPGKVQISRLGVAGPAAVHRTAPQSPRLVVSCSAVSDVKRVGLLYEALRSMPGLSADDPIRWIHFGDGPLFDDLAARTASAPAGLEVELRGRVPNHEVIEFYAAHRVDAFVNVSVSEGVPVSIMEAIAHGIPIVATAVGGTPEIVSPGLGSGELVSADGDAREIGAVLRTLLDAPEGTYDPRAVWRAHYDVRETGRIAAGLVRDVRDAGTSSSTRETP